MPELCLWYRRCINIDPQNELYSPIALQLCLQCGKRSPNPEVFFFPSNSIIEAAFVRPCVAIVYGVREEIYRRMSVYQVKSRVIGKKVECLSIFPQFAVNKRVWRWSPMALYRPVGVTEGSSVACGLQNWFFSRCLYWVGVTDGVYSFSDWSSRGTTVLCEVTVCLSLCVDEGTWSSERFNDVGKMWSLMS